MSLTNEQHIAAFICALAGNGVKAWQIEAAITDCEQNLQLGKSIGRLATKRDESEFIEVGCVTLGYDYAKRLAAL